MSRGCIFLLLAFKEVSVGNVEIGIADVVDHRIETVVDAIDTIDVIGNIGIISNIEVMSKLV